MKILLITVFVLLFSFSIYGADSGLDLLKPDPGGRQAGMGASGSSLTNDVNGVFYNPALSAGADKFTASFSHTSYWENVQVETGAISMSLSPKMSFHSGLRFGSADELEQRGMFPTSEPDAYFDNQDISFKIGVSYIFNDKLSAGISTGILYEKIYVWDGSAINFDLGLIYQLKPNLTLGASAINLGSDFTLTAPGNVDSRPISLPTTFRLGGTYTYDRYLGAVDLVMLDDEMRVHVGAEGKLHRMLKIRSGYMINYDSKNFTAGLSFYKRNMAIDYAFVPFSNDLGTSHNFQFTFSL